MKTFQQLAFVCPEFYTHSWVKKARAYNQYTLLLDFGEQVSHLSQSQLDHRQQVIKQRLLQLTNKHHEAHMEASGQPSLIRDPFESGMWHHSFNLHGIPDVPEAKLHPLPNTQFQGL